MAHRDFLLAPIAAPGPPERSAGESARFGLEVGRLHVSPASRYGVDAVIDAVERTEFDVVILRYPADRIDWFAALCRGRHRAVYADSVHVMRTPLPRETGPDPKTVGARFELVDQHNFGSFMQALRPAFEAHTPHYSADPLLRGVPAADAYENWIRGLLDVPGARVGVTWLGDDATPASFFAVEAYDCDGRRGEFHIIGTQPAHRRTNAATLSADEGHRQLVALGCDASVCLVQISNIPSLNLCLYNGYRPFLAAHTVHLLHPRVLDAA